MQTTLNAALRGALAAFGCVEEAVSLNSLGKGNINDTYLVDDGQQKIVLQRISSTVFPRPEEVAANFAVLTDHIARASQSSAISFLCAQPILTGNEALVHWDDEGNCWRAQSYVEHVPVEQAWFSRDAALQLGSALAHFHLLTADLNIERLYDPLPGFHITPVYLNQFDQTHAQWRGTVTAELNHCFHFVNSCRIIAGRLEDARRKGLIQRRTVHGDPKLDNIIFDEQGRAIGMFDLDTAGPGLIHNDLGDCLRSCCNRAGESPEHYEQVRFDLNICEAVLEGYLQVAGATLSQWDTYFIYDSILVISFELGIRFLTDHLRGDVYFKVMSPGENLLRSLGQFKLCESIAGQEIEIRALVKRLKRNHAIVE